MVSRKQELEDFKTRIPLEDYARSRGYIPDKNSTKNNPDLKTLRVIKSPLPENLMVTGYILAFITTNHTFHSNGETAAAFSPWVNSSLDENRQNENGAHS